MRKKYTLSFAEAAAPIETLVTKFGGQPVWLSEPQWPLSRMYGTPMQFICQIELYPELFGSLGARVAYLFMTDYTGSGLFPDTMLPDAGENAVILQPSPVQWTDSVAVQITALREGPGLLKQEQDSATNKWIKRPCEFAVKLTEGDDPDEFDFTIAQPTPTNAESVHQQELRRTVRKRYNRALNEDKVGGTPVPPVRGDPFPYPQGGPWRLILQLNEDDSRFLVDFGTDGVGYLLLSEDGQAARFLWERP